MNEAPETLIQREHMVYGLTNQRAIILTGPLRRQINSLKLRSLSDVDLEQGASGTATITFGAASVFVVVVRRELARHATCT